MEATSTDTTLPPLFIPLKREYYEAFISGTKRQEYRPWGPRWNERTCVVGRPVVLSLGYGRAHRRTGKIVALARDNTPARLPGWRECYGEREAAAACITIALDPATAPPRRVPTCDNCLHQTVVTNH